jgi:uncharacterized protein
MRLSDLIPRSREAASRRMKAALPHGPIRGKFVIRQSRLICDDPRIKSTDEIAMALQLRPNCEYCDKDLPPNAADARICTYECTFCADCVDNKLHNVCPNCGGGFERRPIRPTTERRPGVCVTKQLPSDKRVHLKYSVEDVAAHCARLKDIPPQER